MLKDIRKNLNKTVIGMLVCAIIIGIGIGYVPARIKYKAQIFLKNDEIIKDVTTINALKYKESFMVPKPTPAVRSGVMMQNGKMLEITNGETKSMMQNITMSDGTKVEPNGKIIMKDGSTLLMKDGEVIDMDGKMTDNMMLLQ